MLASLVTGLLMLYVVGKPVAGMLAALTGFLDGMGTSNAILLGLLLGGMMCVDLGGPVNKAAYAFSVGLLSSHSYAPMAAVMAAGMVPPIGMGCLLYTSPSATSRAWVSSPAGRQLATISASQRRARNRLTTWRSVSGSSSEQAISNW